MSTLVQTTSPGHVTIIKKSPDKLWSKPPPGFVKLLVYGSFHAGDRTARAGMALRDEHGNNIIFTAVEHWISALVPCKLVSSNKTVFVSLTE
jgi:hypothetical protein